MVAHPFLVFKNLKFDFLFLNNNVVGFQEAELPEVTIDCNPAR